MIKVYRERGNRYQREFAAFAMLYGLAVVAFMGFDAWESGRVDWDWLWSVGLLAFIWLLLDADPAPKGPTTLKLDEEGLTYAYFWSTKRWRWSELSLPEIERGDHSDGPFIRLRPARRINWISRFGTPGITLFNSEIRLYPIFDASLKDMVAEMLRYRDLATAGQDA